MPPPQISGQYPSLRPTHRAAGGKQASSFIKSQRATDSFSLSLQEMGTGNTAACKTDGAKLQRRTWKGRRASCVGSRGSEGSEGVGDKGEGQAARWVVDHFWTWRGGEGRGERGREGREAGACHRKAEMQVRASAAPVQVQVCGSFPSWEGRGQPASGGFSGQRNRPSLACLGVTYYTGATSTSGSLRPTASHKTFGLTQRGRGTWRLGGVPGLRCHYLSCFLGKVLLQNLGLAAGEERGLEVQAGRKQEKEH